MQVGMRADAGCLSLQNYSRTESTTWAHQISADIASLSNFDDGWWVERALVAPLLLFRPTDGAEGFQQMDITILRATDYRAAKPGPTGVTTASSSAEAHFSRVVEGCDMCFQAHSAMAAPPSL